MQNDTVTLTRAQIGSMLKAAYPFSNEAERDSVLEAALSAAPAAEPPKPEAWCQPNYEGKIHPRKFMVVYEDAEMGNAVFDDEAEAREHFDKASIAWNCYLFGLLPRDRSVLVPPAASAAVPVAWRIRNKFGGSRWSYFETEPLPDPKRWDLECYDIEPLFTSPPSPKDADGLREVLAWELNIIEIEARNKVNPSKKEWLEKRCARLRASLQREASK